MTYRTDVLAETGLVALWGLDETSGTTAANAVAGGAYPGTYTGTYTLAAPGAVVHAGSAALSVAGAGTVQIPHNAALQPGTLFSVEFWLKTSHAGLCTPYYKWATGSPYNGFGIQVNVAANPGKLGVYLGSVGGFAIGTKTVTDGQWHHVVVIRSDNNTIDIYVDGVLDSTHTRNLTTLGSSQALGLGDAGFVGTLDEVAFYSVALTLGQVQAHYAAGPPPTPTPTQTTYRNAVLADSPVAYWELAETSGTVAADSEPTSPRHGTYGGVYGQGSAGAFGAGSRGLLLAGGGWVTVPHAADLAPAGDFSLECWLKSTATALTWLIKKYNQAAPTNGMALALNYPTANKVGFTASPVAGWNAGATTVNNGAWHHVVVTKAGTTQKLYIDGVLDGTFTQTPLTASTSDLVIGRDDGTAGRELTGSIDEVALYASALSLTQVQAHYAARIQAPPSMRSSTVVVA